MQKPPKKLLKKQGFAPSRVVTDKLRSYPSAFRALGLTAEHVHCHRANNRAENSHQPIRRRDAKCNASSRTDRHSISSPFTHRLTIAFIINAISTCAPTSRSFEPQRSRFGQPPALPPDPAYCWPNFQFGRERVKAQLTQRHYWKETPAEILDLQADCREGDDGQDVENVPITTVMAQPSIDRDADEAVILISLNMCTGTIHYVRCPNSCNLNFSRVARAGKEMQPPHPTSVFRRHLRTGVIFIAVALVIVGGVALWKILTGPSDESLRSDAVPCYPPSHFGPPPGAGYTAEEVRIETEAGHILAGTLTLPENTERPLPVVLLITGSHAQNRDQVGTTIKPFSYYRPFRQIADALSRRGLAVLRVDDQGVGCSEGGPLQDIVIPKRADDTRSGVKFLRSRSDIDAQRIALLGISEGANIAVDIAATDPSIKAIVTMAATATPGWDVYVSQQWQLILNDVYTDKERKQRAVGVDKQTILSERTNRFRVEVSGGKWGPWWQSFMEYDPSEFAPNVKCPVLILHGDRDSNVPVNHADLLAKALRAGGNVNVAIEIFTDHNHLFLRDADGYFRRYKELLSHTNQISGEVLFVIVDWLVLNT